RFGSHVPQPRGPIIYDPFFLWFTRRISSAHHSATLPWNRCPIPTVDKSKNIPRYCGQLIPCLQIVVPTAKFFVGVSEVFTTGKLQHPTIQRAQNPTMRSDPLPAVTLLHQLLLNALF